jgi:ornithine--oxo-acid transaminase
MRDVRGKGLLIGVEIDTQHVSARKVAERLVAHGVLTVDTHGTVIRFAPPLVATRDELAWAIARIRLCFDELDRGIRRAA